MMLRRKCGVSTNLKVGGLISVPSSNVSLGKILNLDLTLMDELEISKVPVEFTPQTKTFANLKK